ncbi:MAG: hypothetical protein HQM16_00465 [Deltaproteobacteria bacterium]|nr:hypothetical protein [Deltaproteobacteria bacterium]
MGTIINWMTELNSSDRLMFGVLTVFTMAGLGISIAIIAELFFRALGIKCDKIEIQH